jgi:hypothetical protein
MFMFGPRLSESYPIALAGCNAERVDSTRAVAVRQGVPPLTEKAMTATDPAAHPVTDPTLDLLYADVRAGFACIATFEGPAGTSWMEVRGRRGMRPCTDGFLTASVPILRLWVPGRTDAPVAVAAANRDFDTGLQAIEEHALPHLHADEAGTLVAMLGVIRDAANGLRPRIPRVGPRLTERGAPSLRGWASCLPLGDLEAALRKAAA